MASGARERLTRDGRGLGSLLSPPDHPARTYVVMTELNRRPENRGSMSIEYAAALPDGEIDPEVRRQCREVLARWERDQAGLADVRVGWWVAHCLGYFRNCYQAADGSWNASQLRIEPDRDLLATGPRGINANASAAVHMIRSYYPAYNPTRDDLARAHWGDHSRVGCPEPV